MNPKPTRTSYSALTSFESCPLSYKLYYLDGHKETGPKPAAERGTRLHTACERFLKNEIPITALSIDFRKIKDVLHDLKLKNAQAEAVWLCDDHGNPQEVEDEHTRFKAIVDIHHVEHSVLYIYDLKSGRRYPEHDDQLQAYATLGFGKYPDVESVVVAALYLEGMGPLTMYDRPIASHLSKFWKARWDKLFAAEEYPATPSVDACQWCPYRASKMGLCVYG